MEQYNILQGKNINLNNIEIVRSIIIKFYVQLSDNNKSVYYTKQTMRINNFSSKIKRTPFILLADIYQLLQIIIVFTLKIIPIPKMQYWSRL